MKALKRIEFTDVYDIKDVLGQLPFYADTCYSISVNVAGYIHNVYTKIILTPSSNPEGWDAFKMDFNTAVKECKER